THYFHYCSKNINADASHPVLPPFLRSRIVLRSHQTMAQTECPTIGRGDREVSMEFEAVLEQTIALLQRQGRISYVALKRRFQLDEAYLEDLKVELIEAQQLAQDENGRILVWTGETASQLPAQDDKVTRASHIPVERLTPDAERRQLTVMFCD